MDLTTKAVAAALHRDEDLHPRPHGRLLPEREWVEDFLHQLCVFPTGAHDDDVDAFSQLVARCLQPERCHELTW